MGVKAKLADLVLDDRLKLRGGLNLDAVERYRQLYLAGKTKAIVIQRGTMLILDGHHRLEAAKQAGLSEVWVEERDLPDHALLPEVLKLNRDHGVPLSREERDRAIRRLYRESGLAQSQIAELVGLSQQWVSNILADDDTVTCNDDRRMKLQDEDIPAVARLLLAGATHEEVAQRFGVARTTITTRWADFRDKVKTAYKVGALKREVAVQLNLTAEEVDAILRGYDPEPLNFTPVIGSLWAGFKIDDRFGQRHPGNVPAELVRNILYYHSRPGDVILDPFAGGGVVLDVAQDMVNRKAYGFDLDPKRDDNGRWDILAGPPPVPEKPDLIFLDPPYADMLRGKYLPHPSQLGDLDVDGFLDAMTKVFGYWDSGTLVLLMGCLQRGGEFFALPFESAKRMEAAGWRVTGWLVNEVNRPGSETAVTLAAYRKA
ncbi:MAG: DNA methyltransferase, partial [Bacillota bacterium]|nr:DNA methyltransferase [Bacillota bacterium]